MTWRIRLEASCFRRETRLNEICFLWTSWVLVDFSWANEKLYCFLWADEKLSYFLQANWELNCFLWANWKLSCFFQVNEKLDCFLRANWKLSCFFQANEKLNCFLRANWMLNCFLWAICRLNCFLWAIRELSCFLWVDWSRQVEYLSSSRVLDSKSVKSSWNFFEKVSSRIEKLNSSTRVELRSLTRQFDLKTRLDSTRY